jgi:hypothetical protein
MASKKRKRSRSRPGEDAARPAVERQDRPGTRDGGAERRRRKQEAREARERARKQEARRAALRRAGVFVTLGAVSLGAFWVLNRAAARDPIPEEAVAAAAAASCSTPRTQLDDPSRDHREPDTIAYDERPATAGAHEATPLPIPPHVSAEPVVETRAVHNLEHGAVFLYYRADGEGALAADVVERLASIAEGSRSTVLAPYPDLPDGTGLALAAWNYLQTCPGSIAADQAAIVARGFIEATECKGQPEPGIAPCD